MLESLLFTSTIFDVHCVQWILVSKIILNANLESYMTQLKKKNLQLQSCTIIIQPVCVFAKQHKKRSTGDDVKCRTILAQEILSQ